MKNILSNAAVVTLIAGLSFPVLASETSPEALAKDPLVVSGCEERAAEENVPAEGVAAYIQQCLEDLANELPEGEDEDKLAKTKRDTDKAKN